MSSLGQPRKAKTRRGQREIKKRAPKIIENEKKGIFIRGATCSNVVAKALTDLCALKKPAGKLLSNKNAVRPFEDAASLEFLSRVNDASVFCFGSDSKKRPHSLVFGRTFDHQVLDMLEFQLDPASFKSIQDLAPGRELTSRLGARPMFVFVGDTFVHNEDMRTFKSLVLDMFHGVDVPKVNLIALDRVVVVTGAVHPQDIRRKLVTFRHYNVAMKKSGGRVPRAELEEVGPRMDLTFNRSTGAAEEMRKEAMRVHKAARMQLGKNEEIGQLGQKLGRIHMQRQDLNEIALAKLKGLGKRVNPNAKRGREEMEAEAGARRNGTIADDYAQAEQQSTKKAKKLPTAYANAVISE